jgi:hypothetical protein
MSAPAIGSQTRCYVDPGDLICPGCGEPINAQPPVDYLAGEGCRTPDFSHHDGSALCLRSGGAPAEPIESEAAGRGESPRWDRP